MYHISYLGILEVMPPERPYFVLTTNIPYCKTNVLIFYCFHIKTYKEKKIVVYNVIKKINLFIVEFSGFFKVLLDNQQT